jgi:hypothetical protein
MLFKETVDTPTLELLTRLMRDNAFDQFVLVGGTAIALYLGHRMSIDIDLFSIDNFDENKLAEYLRENFAFELDSLARNTLKGEIDGVQLDCIAHKYQLLDEVVENEGIRIAGLMDLAAMKLNAVSGNGTRVKDFIDVAYLSQKLSLNQMLRAYEMKYKSNPLIPLKAITWFADINFNEPIRLIQKNKFNWAGIEKRLSSMSKQPNKIFPSNTI